MHETRDLTQNPSKPQDALVRTLSPLMVWGLGVGYVISGMYFGWNLGLKEGGPVGMLLATLLVTLLYVAFIFCYAELATMMPKAGGAFYYANRIMGPNMGFFVGFSQAVEFIFAPAAIAYAIGAYFSLFWPSLSPLLIAFGSYALFTVINIYGVKLSALLELFLTIFAVAEILIFVGVCAPHFSAEKFMLDALPHGGYGIFLAVPFAIWFYLGLEGIANVAEEIKDPHKNLAPSFKAAMASLAILAGLVLFSAVGVAGWRAVVYPQGSNTLSDSPLPLAMGLVVGQNNVLYHLLITVGLFGLVASFHGLILAAGRATMELGREGFLPKFCGHTLKNRHTPAFALVANMVLGMLALVTGRTEEIILLSVLAAIVMYILSLVVFIQARIKFPHEHRPFKAPYFPLTPLLALVIALVALAAVVAAKPVVVLLFAVLMLAFWLYFILLSPLKKLKFKSEVVDG